ncbi:hypothetical protein DER46DRAFT_664428 [Fusarium sp. MPI-SDFR-AT-0072]|nr:hypothetical protein DER46DRAFT_664428 [Fusarium sp. MPI-SDFR-AT-0072]
MSPTGRKRTTVPASAVTAESTKRIRLPNYAGNSSSTSRPRPGRLGSPTRHALDDLGTAALRCGKGSGLFVAHDPDVSVARSSQSLRRKTLSSGQDPDADAHSNLPYERKLKKFVSQRHASLVKKDIPEHLAYELAKDCVQASDGEGDLGTDSHHMSCVMKPLFLPLPGALLGGTQVFPDAMNTYREGNEDGGIPSQPSANLIPTQIPQTDNETVVIRLAAGARAPKQGLGRDNKPTTLVEALRAKSRLKNHSKEGHEAFDTLAVARRL